MVSKIAVMALVALVAFPVGLGYALNFQDVETTTYETGTSTNVTQLLQNDQSYDTVNANPYQLNGNQFVAGFDKNPNDFVIGNYPKYNNFSTAVGPLKIVESFDSWGTHTVNPNFLFWQVVTNLKYTDQSAIVNPNIAIFNMYNEGGATPRLFLDNVMWAALVPGSHKTIDSTVVANYQVGYVEVTGRYLVDTVENVTSVELNGSGSPVGNVFTFGRTIVDNRDKYPVFSDGFNINSDSVRSKGFNSWIAPGSGVKDLMLTLDLSTVSGSFSIMQLIDQFGPGGYRNAIPITNTSTIHQIAGIDVIYVDGQPNIYQVFLSSTGAIVRYIGDSWPSKLGEANYYRQWKIAYSDMPKQYYADWANASRPVYEVDTQNLTELDYIRMLSFFNTSETQAGATTYNNFTIGKIRFDIALMRSSQYPTIHDNTYNPAKIIGQTQNTTSIDKITRYGDSITFGGETFPVNSKGQIIVLPGAKPVALEKCKFETVWDNDAANFVNRISGTEISTTAAPATITFNGVWVANVQSSGLTPTTTTESKWIPGEWAWDGVGTSFAVVGLITCVGVFVGLGMYGRRSGAKVGSLMLICAGGALIFLSIM